MRLIQLTLFVLFTLSVCGNVSAAENLTIHVTMTGLQNTTHVATGCPAPTPSNFSMSTSNVASHCTAVTGGQSTCTLAMSSSGSTETLALQVTPYQLSATASANAPTYPKCTSMPSMKPGQGSLYGAVFYPASGTLPFGLNAGFSQWASICPTNGCTTQKVWGQYSTTCPNQSMSLSFKYSDKNMQKALVQYGEKNGCSFAGFTTPCEIRGYSDYTTTVTISGYKPVKRPCADFTPGPVVSKSYTFTIPDASTAPSANTLSGLMSDVSRMGCSRWVGGVVDHSAVTGYIRRQLIASCQASASATTVNLYCSYSATSGISCTPPQ